MEGRTMKRTVKRAMVILSTVVALLTTVALYAGYGHTDTRKKLTLEEAYNAGFPAELPDVLIQPLNGATIF
jgi:hypothetical protein